MKFSAEKKRGCFYHHLRTKYEEVHCLCQDEAHCFSAKMLVFGSARSGSTVFCEFLCFSQAVGRRLSVMHTTMILFRCVSDRIL